MSTATILTPTQLRARILGRRRRACQREVEYRTGDAAGDIDTGDTDTSPAKGPCLCPVFNVTSDSRVFCAACESGSINGLATDDKLVRRAVALRIILVDVSDAAKLGVEAGPSDGNLSSGVLVEMRAYLERCEIERQQRQEQRRLDGIRAKNVATLAALEQKRLKGF